MITTADALRSLKPGAEWSLRDDDELEWLDSEQTEPTQAEIDTEIARLDAEYVANEYQRDRASAYPTWQDQLDDIFHNGIDGWKATLQVTKDKYPK